ncbi:glycosyltransferase [Arthrobacter sp. Sa2BUA2]|uniref:Glycosyltransferase n=1 Tax=Arthrobacter pullicola TaxID=2762224 RepID=A0ABR8YFT9_9MICC|nr:glycosyltransferase [Arthrobacter pullicola]MBD8043087.1 glycosyltransferase [Arthrobacter pullicola]
MADGQAPEPRPLRVLQVGGLAGPGAAAGGVWAVARMQSAALAAAGAAVELVGGWLGAPPPVKAGTSPHGVRYFRVHRPFPGAKLRGLVSLALPRYAAAHGRTADVVHVHLCRDFITTAATLLLRRTGVPVVAQTHGMLVPSVAAPVRVFDRIITRHMVRIPALWLTLTAQEEQDLQQLGVRPSRMRRVVNAVPDPVLRWSDPEQQVFLFAARLAARKQPAVFVQAAIEALDAGLDARFILAGPDQGEAEKVRALIAGSGHAERFELTGELGPKDVQAAMGQCTAFVLPSLNEPYPMAVIEAAALGVPLIVSTECGLAPDLEQAGAAVLSEPTAAALAEAMRKLGADAQARNGLSARALNLHRAIWSADILAQDLLSRYRLASSSKQGPGARRRKEGTR